MYASTFNDYYVRDDDDDNDEAGNGVTILRNSYTMPGSFEVDVTGFRETRHVGKYVSGHCEY